MTMYNMEIGNSTATSDENYGRLNIEDVTGAIKYPSVLSFKAYLTTELCVPMSSFNRWQISSKLNNKNLDVDRRRHLDDLETKLVSEMKKLQLPCTDQKTLAKQRNQTIVARCFHKIGIVVPYDKKTELGYRPLPMNDRK